MKFKTPQLLLALALLALPTQADFITGRVVDSFGVGVNGVDIDVKNLGGGGTPPIFNDGTDALGNFVTTVPAGLYRVTFTPPIPPLSSHLVTEVEDVIIVGTKDMGTIVLPPGVLVSGSVRNPANLPIAGVNIDVIDLTTGENLILAGDLSNAFGDFVVAAPAGPIELRLNPSGVLGPVLAPRALSLQLAGATDVGTVKFEPGFRISGTVLGPGSVPIEDADFDISQARTGDPLYTPDDNTDPFGAFSIVVPAGRFRAELCAVNGEQLVGRVIKNIAVNADTNIGVLEMEAGVVLSGTVRAFDGATVAGADVDADRSDGTPIHLCADNSDQFGNYSVIVPSDVLSLEFDPPGFALPLGTQDVSGVNVVGNTVFNASLPACPFGTSVGTGTPGTGAMVPSLDPFGGAPRAGNTAYGLELSAGVGGGAGFLSLSLPPKFSSRSAFPNGQLFGVVTSPTVLSPKTKPLTGVAGVAGAGTAKFPMPVDSSMIGTSIVARAYVLDPVAAGGLASTNAVLVKFCE